MSEQKLYEVHLNADKNLSPETASALSDLFRLAYEQVANNQSEQSKKEGTMTNQLFIVKWKVRGSSERIYQSDPMREVDADDWIKEMNSKPNYWHARFWKDPYEPTESDEKKLVIHLENPAVDPLHLKSLSVGDLVLVTPPEDFFEFLKTEPNPDMERSLLRQVVGELGKINGFKETSTLSDTTVLVKFNAGTFGFPIKWIRKLFPDQVG